MNLRRLGSIVAKELLQLRRDRLTFAMIVGIPIMQLVLFGYAINMDVRHLEAGVLDQSNSVRSRELVAEMAATDILRFKHEVRDSAGIDALLRGGTLSAVLLIPAGLRDAPRTAGPAAGADPGGRLRPGDPERGPAACRLSGVRLPRLDQAGRGRRGGELL